ncbi:hypothetical protein GCM10020221_20060 [Streptomyces thioluteus]|uniref:Uncharacterized protein n=1 Tax=Streptomyces thioluteus TaxID=66431 RepID=A0ABN3WQC1_STRTU
MKKFMPIAQKKERRGAKASTSRPASRAGPQVFDAVGEGVGELQVGRRARFLDVVAGDGDGVVARHPREVYAKMSEMIRIEGRGG